MRSLSITVRRLAPLVVAALLVAAFAAPAGAQPYESAHGKAAILGPHSFAASSPSTASDPVAPATATGADESTPWASIGFGVAGMLLLIAGTTVLVRRHDRTRHHVAQSA